MRGNTKFVGRTIIASAITLVAALALAAAVGGPRFTQLSGLDSVAISGASLDKGSIRFFSRITMKPTRRFASSWDATNGAGCMDPSMRASAVLDMAKAIRRAATWCADSVEIVIGSIREPESDPALRLSCPFTKPEIRSQWTPRSSSVKGVCFRTAL